MASAWVRSILPFMKALKEVLCRLPEEVFCMVESSIQFIIQIPKIHAYSVPFEITYPENYRIRQFRLDPTQRQSIYNQMLRDIARYCNPLRPGRVEPRRVKRNDGQYPYLSIPRDLARKKCLS